MNISYTCVAPSQIENETLSQLVDMIVDGNQVSLSARSLFNSLSNCHMICYAMDDNQPVGVVALKRPNPDYIYSVFEKAEVPEDADNYISSELGYVYIKPEYRSKGIAKPMLTKIIAKMHLPTCATTRTDNGPMIRLLQQMGFREHGEPYPSFRGNYDLVLFVID